MDADGNDNSPEWGYCTHSGCRHEAFPLWFSGAYPDDPDMLLCQDHIASRMNGAIVLLQACYRRLDDLIAYKPHGPARELSEHIYVFLKEVQHG